MTNIIGYALASGWHGGRTLRMMPAKLRLAQAAIGKPETKVSELCAELDIIRKTLHRHFTPDGNIRPDGETLPNRKAADSPLSPENLGAIATDQDKSR